LARFVFGNKSVATSWVDDENDGLGLGSLEVFGAVLFIAWFFNTKALR
jgi:hypothetical protein